MGGGVKEPQKAVYCSGTVAVAAILSVQHIAVFSLIHRKAEVCKRSARLGALYRNAA